MSAKCIAGSQLKLSLFPSPFQSSSGSGAAVLNNGAQQPRCADGPWHNSQVSKSICKSSGNRRSRMAIINGERAQEGQLRGWGGCVYASWERSSAAPREAV